MPHACTSQAHHSCGSWRAPRVRVKGITLIPKFMYHGRLTYPPSRIRPGPVLVVADGGHAMSALARLWPTLVAALIGYCQLSTNIYPDSTWVDSILNLVMTTYLRSLERVSIPANSAQFSCLLRLEEQDCAVPQVEIDEVLGFCELTK